MPGRESGSRQVRLVSNTLAGHFPRFIGDLIGLKQERMVKGRPFQTHSVIGQRYRADLLVRALIERNAPPGPMPNTRPRHRPWRSRWKIG
jgi:hypothetical protein